MASPTAIPSGADPEFQRRNEWDDLAATLSQEAKLLDELREALLQQRGGVASNDAAVVEGSIQMMGRTLLTLGEARQRREALIGRLAGQPVSSPSISNREELLSQPLPENVQTARAAARRAGAAVAVGVVAGRDSEEVAVAVEVAAGVKRRSVHRAAGVGGGVFNLCPGVERRIRCVGPQPVGWSRPGNSKSATIRHSRVGRVDGLAHEDFGTAKKVGGRCEARGDVDVVKPLLNIKRTCAHKSISVERAAIRQVFCRTRNLGHAINKKLR